MRSALLLSAVGLYFTGVLLGQHSKGVPAVVVHGPTVVAFFPNAATTGPDDADANEALSDFQLYAAQAKEPLKQMGIELYEQFDRSFRIRSASGTRLFTPKPNTPGYCFVAPHKKPHIEYGVMTDTDLLDTARRYFGIHHSR